MAAPKVYYVVCIHFWYGSTYYSLFPLFVSFAMSPHSANSWHAH